MAAILDPFFGVFPFGKFVARWFNRILIVAEVAATVWGFKYHCDEVWLSFEWWWKALYFPACLMALGIVNRFIRMAWCVVVVFVHGSANPDEIAAHHEAKIERRERLADYIAEKRGIRAERIRKRRDARYRRLHEFSGKDLNDIYTSASMDEAIKKVNRRRALAIFLPFLR